MKLLIFLTFFVSCATTQERLAKVAQRCEMMIESAQNCSLQPGFIGFSANCNSNKAVNCYKAGKFSYELNRYQDALRYHTEACKHGFEKSCDLIPKMKSLAATK